VSNYYDTYFFSTKRAERIAKELNKLETNSFKTQICYHSGGKTCKNLINIPFNSFKLFFKNNSYRYPTYIDFNESDYENDEKSQDQIIKIFATLIEEISKEELVYTKKLSNDFNNIKISYNKNNIKIGFIATRNFPNIFKFLKNINKNINKNYTSKFLIEKTTTGLLLSDFKTKDVYKFMISFKPNILIYYNEFNVILNHNDIINIFIVDSFYICNKIIEEEQIDSKRNIFFTTTAYYKNILESKNIYSQRLIPIINKKNIHVSFDKEKEYDLVICDAYVDLSDYIVFQKVFKKMKKHIKANKILTLDIILSFIEISSYSNMDDLELNLFIQKNIVLQTFVDNLSTEKYKIGINKSWKTYKKCKLNYLKNDKFKKTYKNSKYILIVDPSILSSKLLEILSYGMVPLIYDLRKQDSYYDEMIDDYCLFVTKINDINNIINNNIQPKRIYDSELKKEYSIKRLIHNLF